MRPTVSPRLTRTVVAVGAAALLAPALHGSALAHESGDVGTADPALETAALFDDEAGGFADPDDPAIWLHPDRPSKSLVLATAKERGLYAYRMSGRTLQHVPAPEPPGPGDRPGRFNNVDLVYGFDLGGDRVDLAVVSDRGRDTLRIYTVDPSQIRSGSPLTDVTEPAAPFIFSADQDEVNTERTAYGLTTWQDGDDTYVLASQASTTRLALLRLFTAGGTVGYEVVRTLDLPESFTLPDGTTWRPCDEPGELPQVEGLVVDRQRDILYAAQEQVGIWRMAADLSSEPTLFDRVREYGVPATYDPELDECVFGDDPGHGGEHLAADVEGLALYYLDDADGYLIASSQGDDTVAVYDREPGNDAVGSFRVSATRRIDSVEGTDGLDVLNVAMGRFCHGLFVVHDGENTPVVRDEDGEPRDNGNFKFVGWDEVAESFDDELDVDPDGWDPRDR